EREREREVRYNTHSTHSITELQEKDSQLLGGSLGFDMNGTFNHFLLFLSLLFSLSLSLSLSLSPSLSVSLSLSLSLSPLSLSLSPVSLLTHSLSLPLFFC